MAARHGIKSLKGVKKSRSVGNRPKHSKKSVKLRKLVRSWEIFHL
jgi:hypothetical protein